MPAQRITSQPSICGARLCIRDTRIRVSDVCSLLAHGASTEEILADYPLLEAEDISACLRYAEEQLKSDRFARLIPHPETIVDPQLALNATWDESAWKHSWKKQNASLTQHTQNRNLP